MAWAPRRSMTADLSEGATDGRYKKVVQNRGGQVEQTFVKSRQDLSDAWYGIHESVGKTRPDSQRVATPESVPTPTPNPSYF